MSRPRIAIAGFQHETNTFCPLPTPFEEFEQGSAWPGLTRGQAVIDVFSSMNIPIGGFINAAADMDLVPILWTAAEPSSYVTTDAFDRITGMICDGIREAGEIDGVYLDLHGAMVTEDFDDGEGEVLRRVREVIGPDLPLAVSLDLHGNQTAEFAALADAVTIYRTYPHIDMAETGARAHALLKKTLERGKPYAMAFRQAGYMVAIQAQSTMREPCRRLYEDMAALEGGGVVSIDLATGFPPADIPHCGMSHIVYAETQAQADTAADRMLEILNEAESDFDNPLLPVAEAVSKAISLSGSASKPISIADPQDNPGAGGTGDTTGILAELVAQGARGAALSMLWDAEAAAKAHEVGVGGKFQALLGGKFPELGCEPVEAEVTVDALSDGSFLCTGPMYGGSHAELGPCASLLIEEAGCEVRVVVGTIRSQNADQTFFSHIGIEPSEQNILVVKSAVHFLADYEPISETVLFADAPGANPCKLDQIGYTKLRLGLRLGANGPAFQGR